MAHNPEFEKMYLSTKICKEIKCKKSLIIKPEFFMRLNEIFAEQYSDKYKVYYICQLRNSSIKKYTSYEDLIKCDNALERSIQRLEIRAISHEDKKLNFHIVIGLDPAAFIAKYTAKGEINSDFGHIDQFEKDIDYQLRKTIKSRVYSIISKAGIIPTLFFTAIFSFLHFHFLGLISFDNISPFWNTIAQYAFLGYMGLVEARLFLIPIKKVFPRVVFLFGNVASKEKKKYELMRKIIWNFIVPLIVGVASTYLYGWLSGNL